MINDIKLDSLGNSLSTQKTSQQPQAPVAGKTENIVVSDNVSKIAKMLVADEEISSQNSRVLEMKQKIQSGTYTIDTDALSEKLTQTLFTNKNGI